MDYLEHENRFGQVKRHDPERFSALVAKLEQQIRSRQRLFEILADIKQLGQEQNEAISE